MRIAVDKRQVGNSAESYFQAVLQYPDSRQPRSFLVKQRFDSLSQTIAVTFATGYRLLDQNVTHRTAASLA